MKILITGAAGLVGRALKQHCLDKDDEVIAYDHAGLDIANFHDVENVLTTAQAEVVINCAAWTDVDGCERDAERCEAMNATGPENLARLCRQTGSLLITISTDYVFDGRKAGFYTQRDNPNPISIYGRSKLQGEWRTQQHHARTIVVRTGFIFGTGGKNFLSTVLDRVRRGEKISAIDDAWGTPTYVNDLVGRLRELAMLDLPGVFHVVNSGEGATYAAFASETLRLAGYDQSSLERVAFDSLLRPAPRPQNSRLKCLYSERLGLPPLPPWEEGLSRFVRSFELV